MRLCHNEQVGVLLVNSGLSIRPATLPYGVKEERERDERASEREIAASDHCKISCKCY